jgi:hypothetical protein
MKVPYLNKRINAEFEEYLVEMTSHVSECVSNIKVRIGVRRVYGALFPLFMFLRELRAVDFGGDPSKNMILDQMRMRGDKDGFVEALASRPFSGHMRAALAEAVKEMTFTTYLNELWSDALLCINSITLLNYRGSHIALRCMLEDLYRHLYYKDHPEEYGSLRFDPVADDNFRMTPGDLRDYLTKVACLRQFATLDDSFCEKSGENSMDMFDLNAELYALTSGYVHGAKLGSMNSFKSNSNATHDSGREDVLIGAVSRFVKMACAFLISAHFDEFKRFSDYDKSVVFSAFTVAERHGFRRAMNV